MKRCRPLLLACLFAMPLSALAVDTDKDGVANAVDPAPNNILVSGYQPPWLHTFNGDSAHDSFGYSVSDAGDVDNDGVDDVIVGAWGDNNNGSDSGSARIFSGANGAILYTFYGDSAFDAFGGSVSGAGDVNADGYDDVIVGAYGDDNNGKTDSGSARVLSGANGSILYTFNGDSVGDQFGMSVSGAGDVNNDGYADVIVGAPDDDNYGSRSGSARVLSGANGNILYTFNGDSVDDIFGLSVSGAGDVNADGYDDVIVGAWGDDNNGDRSGSARVFSGLNGAILYTFNGDSAADYFGYSVSDAGDVNNDGVADVIVGAAQDDNNGKIGSGSARVFSGANGAILYTFNGDGADDWFGSSVSGAGDVNNDGFDDVIVGADLDDNNGWNSGSARVLSGANGAILYTFNGDSVNDYFGRSVSGAGDVNNDGYADVIVAASGDDNNGDTSGSARIFSGALFLQQTTDSDTDGLVDTLDTNDDADSMPDVSDAFPQDTDNDGIPNSIDLDGDNDGVLNNIDPDDDNDGVPDAFDATPLGQQMSLNGIYKGSTINDSAKPL